jgi:hypothetical protein
VGFPLQSLARAAAQNQARKLPYGNFLGAELPPAILRL